MKIEKDEKTILWLVANKGPMFYSQKARAEAGPELANVMNEVKELLAHMEQIPLLRFEILSFFHKFKLEYKDVVASAMMRTEENR